jgi:hypothetical protein
VKIYDIKTDIFKFNSSYSWSKLPNGENALYFLGSKPGNNIYRFGCSGQSCEETGPLKVAGSYCAPRIERQPAATYLKLKKSWKGNVVWAPLGACRMKKGDEETRIDFDAIDWMAPYVYRGREYLVAQATVRVYRRLKASTKFVTRMVLLEVVE